MKKNIIVFALLLTSTFACGQKKMETVTLANGKTIIIYDNKTWAYSSTQTRPQVPVDNSKTSNPNNAGSNNHYNNKSNGSENKTSYSSTCGAPTKKGGACQRKVSGGGRCWQH